MSNLNSLTNRHIKVQHIYNLITEILTEHDFPSTPNTHLHYNINSTCNIAAAFHVMTLLGMEIVIQLFFHSFLGSSSAF